MDKKTIVIVTVIVILAGLLSGCLEIKSGSGVITDKWYHTVKDGFGSSTEYYFEIEESYVIVVTPTEYHNYDIGNTITFKDKEVSE